MSRTKFWPWLFWYGVFNLWLAELIGSLYLVQAHLIPASPWAWLFVFFYWNGHLAALTFLLLSVFLLPLWLLSKVDWHRGVAAILLTFVVLIYFIDTFVYGQYRFHINGMVLDLLLHGHGQIIYFSWQSWLTLGAVFLALLGGEYAAARWIDRKVPLIEKRKWGRALAGFYFFSLIAMHVIHIYASAMFYSPITRIDSVLPFSVPAEAQDFLAQHHLLNVAEYRKRQEMRVPDENSSFHYPLAPLQCTPPKKPLNVMWILVDALRSDMIDANIMPNVYKLSQESNVFLNHYSNSNTTRYGLFSMFYGIPGTYFRVAMNEHVRPVMMEQFARDGYNFGIYGSAPLTKPEFDQTVFLDIPNLRLISKAQRDYNRDREITTDMLQFLNQQAGANAQGSAHVSTSKKPFFGFMFYDSCHGYSVPPGFKKKFMPDWASKNYMLLNNDADPTPVRNSYQNAALFVDGMIGQVLDRMRALRMLDNTVILISSDHGQEFNDNHLNYWGHNSNYSPAQTHVPMVVYWPGRAPSQITRRTEHFDLAPTFVKHVLGCTTPTKEYSSGHDLFGKTVIPWVLMDREYDYAISKQNQIILLKPNGDYEVVDQHYRPIDHPQLNMPEIVTALREFGRFYR